MNGARFVTINPQKDGRIVLGTAVHKYEECRTLKKRTHIDISGAPELVKQFPKCAWCYQQAERERN